MQLINVWNTIIWQLERCFQRKMTLCYEINGTNISYDYNNAIKHINGTSTIESTFETNLYYENELVQIPIFGLYWRFCKIISTDNHWHAPRVLCGRIRIFTSITISICSASFKTTLIFKIATADGCNRCCVPHRKRLSHLGSRMHLSKDSTEHRRWIQRRVAAQFWND